MQNPKSFLSDLFRAAVDAADPALCLPPALPHPPRGRTVVIGAGKAAAAMAEAVERHWPGPLSGVVVTRYGHAGPTAHIAVREAAHPVPDAAGEAAAREVLAAVQGLSADDLVLCLISGGGSALMPLPLPGLTLADKQVVNTALLRSGAPIDAMNCVRRHLSAIKGGRLAAAAHPARVVTLAISDVPGDDPGVIASGPTVGDATTSAQALAVIDRYRLDVPVAVRAVLADVSSESIKPGDARLARAEFHLIATPAMALDAAARRAREAGVDTVMLGDGIEGEARAVAATMAAEVLREAQGATRARPRLYLSGGETTVTVRGGGRGGRNVEFLLALALALDGARGVHALAADTDGVDGAAENAGAFIGPETLARARAIGLDAAAMLADNDAHTFFEALGDTLVTGPTRTNVNDFRAILITPA